MATKKQKRKVIITLLGPKLDAIYGERRLKKWRPTVALVKQPDFQVDRVELIYQVQFETLKSLVVGDMATSAPNTKVSCHATNIVDPWAFDQMYSTLYDFARSYHFNTEEEDYYVHITTGTHTAQICLFLLCEARYFPGQLLQTSPARGPGSEDTEGDQESVDRSVGSMSVIDLDLSKYDKLWSRFTKEKAEGAAFLRAGIATGNKGFSLLMERMEKVASSSSAPMLLTGPTGAGKTKMAKRIYELKKMRQMVRGAFVELNCATLRGDAAVSALFGHVKGAYTGAVSDRDGLLLSADGGMLFLDEVGELGLDEQAMLLRALEDKVFRPMGAEKEKRSDFQLLCGTNRDLGDLVRRGLFREDLLARINLWSFRLPGLAERREDIEPNLDYELERHGEEQGVRLTLTKEARAEFLAFASAPGSSWSGNFRDLSAAVLRMATFASSGRIGLDAVTEEMTSLRTMWSQISGPKAASEDKGLVDATPGLEENLVFSLIGAKVSELDRFDLLQLSSVVSECRRHGSLSAAGRALFGVSRTQRSSRNDAARLSKYLARYGITTEQLWPRVSG